MKLNLRAAISLAACAIAGGFAVIPAISQAPAAKPAQNAPQLNSTLQNEGTAAPAAATQPKPGYHFHSGTASRARKYYALVWGVDDLKVRSMESGELIRFNYRIIDPDKAQLLNDKKVEPFLVDETAHVKLSIPSLEKVGQLRQVPTPEAGKVYWMAFSNKGGYVKAGHQVSVVIGSFRATSLIVE